MTPPKSPKPILSVGLIGQRFMGKAHSNAWRQAPRFFDLPVVPELHTVAGRDPESLQAFADNWGFAHTTTDWRTLAADDDVDLVDIVTPNDLHEAPALEMLLAGKHVACEKPLSSTLEGARRMRDAAAAPGAGQTFVWFNYRRCPAVALMHELVQEGRIGEVLHVRGTYLQSWGGPETPMLWRFDKERAGSGAHGDLNAHIVDMARFVTGQEFEAIHGAIAKTFVEERKNADGSMSPSTVDDVVSFLAMMESGATASFEASRLAQGHLNRNTLEINGTKGSVRFDFEDMNVLNFIDGTEHPRTRGWRRIMCTDGEHHPYAGAWWPDAHVIGYEHGFTNMVADICQVLGGGAPRVKLPDFADAFETQAVLEAALIAAERGAIVEMGSVREG
ncbi:1,5-anhydro-D-fructose reductase [Planctomycetes bacterium Poly30]|uniref:1,5-anhydro-D-fructose reductase n=1 Tax=Saltatorellus ferox TaxID=2528018 RepID=A0A518EU41_9BACT|nr:1,5-anhydro-D-fructose reductase [Planctomycetes bacterium Poly30]